GSMIDVSVGKSDDFIQNRNQVVLIFLLILVAQGVFSFLRVYIFAKVNEPVLANIRKDLYNKIICFPMSFFEKTRTGELQSRLTNDVTALSDILSLTLAEFFRQFAILIVGIGLLFYTSVKLTLIMLATFPIVIVLGILLSRFIRNNSKNIQEALAKANVVLDETLMSIQSVKAYTREAYESQRYATDIDASKRLGIINAIFRGGFVTFIIVVVFGAIVFIFWSGTGMVEQNHIDPNTGITPGKLIEFLMYTIFIGGSFGGLSDSLGRIVKAIGATERIVDILNTPTETDINNFTPLKLDGNIVFQNVAFAYPTRKDIDIFKDLNLTIEKGQKVALVGPSGAGKSTIIQLILKYYDVDSGTISIANTNINDINVKQLRDNMAIVPQEVLLFGGSIKENILYGKLDATDEEIIQAAKQANALEFIEQFPEGLNTVVGERGIKLSGGQRQRIAIARAILKNPPILLLDEATSSLDAESEHLVQAALNTLMENRTTIIIAHRLSTIRNVDKILVLNHGKIVEQGSHEELSTQDGLYSNLLKLQFQLN
ncbi:MAG: ABC transporter transmembrane domain-containing protein, partial [Chitinophagales bacterium]